MSLPHVTIQKSVAAALSRALLASNCIASLNLTLNSRFSSVEEAVSFSLKPNSRKIGKGDFTLAVPAIFQNQAIDFKSLSLVFKDISSEYIQSCAFVKHILIINLKRERVFSYIMDLVRTQGDRYGCFQQDIPSSVCILLSLRFCEQLDTSNTMRLRMASIHLGHLLEANGLASKALLLKDLFQVASPHFLPLESREEMFSQFLELLQTCPYFNPEANTLDLKTFASDTGKSGSITPIHFSQLDIENPLLRQLFSAHVLTGRHTTVVCLLPDCELPDWHTLQLALGALAAPSPGCPGVSAMARFPRVPCGVVAGMQEADAVNKSLLDLRSRPGARRTSLPRRHTRRAPRKLASMEATRAWRPS
jgi:hypothetical protein